MGIGINRYQKRLLLSGNIWYNFTMKSIWVHKAISFKEAEDFDKGYYLNMSRSNRLELMQLLREQYFKLKKQVINGNTKRLRRSVKIIQQT